MIITSRYRTSRTAFPFLCSQLASALLLRPSNAENKEIPSFLPASSGRPRGLNSAKVANFSKAESYKGGKIIERAQSIQKACCHFSMPVVCFLHRGAELRRQSFLLIHKQFPWEERVRRHMLALAPNSTLKAKAMVAAVGDFPSYPVSSRFWGHLNAMLTLSTISSLGRGVQVLLLCISSQAGALASPKRVNSFCHGGVGFFPPHANQNTKACVERSVADRYILSLPTVLGKITDKADFCLMRGRKRRRKKRPGESPSVVLPVYFHFSE